MLVRQKNGATGQMDKLYPLVMGERNGWLGGDGDQWERGPYWIDGLLPLAYLLDDTQLKAKVQPWIEWALNSQRILWPGQRLSGRSRHTTGQLTRLVATHGNVKDTSTILFRHQ